MSHLFKMLSLTERKTKVTSIDRLHYYIEMFSGNRIFFKKGIIWFHGHWFLCLKINIHRHKENAGKGSFSDFLGKQAYSWASRSFLIRLWNEWRFNYFFKRCVYSVFHSQVIYLFCKCSLLFFNYLLFKAGVLSYWLTWLQWSNLNNGCLF